MHIYKTNIKLHQTDAAGLLFYSRIFEITNDAFQDLLEKSQLDLSELLSSGDLLTPVVHAEADYKMPLKVGDQVEVRLTLDGIGKSSYTLSYDILKDNQIAGWVKIVHVSLSKTSGEKTSVPERLKNILARHPKDIMT
jgi:1,4-dihydroxy-2-naphthoyl-CoA hydrolase